MGMPAIPMINRDPLELGTQVPLHLRHQIPGVGFEILELRSVFGRDDEPELMPVALAAAFELLEVDLVSDLTVGAASLAVRRHPFPFQILEMGCG